MTAVSGATPRRLCTAGRTVMGVTVYGRRTRSRGPCDRWSCEVCRGEKVRPATAAARKYRAAGGTFWAAELGDIDVQAASAVRALISDRASKARELLLLAKDSDPLHVSEYFCVRRLRNLLIVASLNLGGLRKPPYSRDFQPLGEMEELERLIDRWFCPAGLFAMPGSSDLRTSASRGWSQRTQDGPRLSAWKPLGAVRADLEDQVWSQWSGGLVQRCSAFGVCHHLADDEFSHNLGLDEVLAEGREAMLAVMGVVEARNAADDPWGLPDTAAVTLFRSTRSQW